jgi:restriction system protein
LCMAIPTYDLFIDPVLRILAESPDGLRTTKVQEAAANWMELSTEDREELLPSGKQPTFKNRIGWAHDRLKRAGLSTSPARRFWRLTDAGSAFAQAHPSSLTDEEIERIAIVEPGTTIAGDKPKNTERLAAPPIPASLQAPGERIDAAVVELEEALSRDLLEIVRRSSPTFFEHLILELLLRMGYGANASDLERTGQSGDGGIDGVISLDRLGLDKVYLQAKRWQGENKVGREEIQSFVGALAGRRATRGVFITTSSFSGPAVEYAKQVSDSLILVDGNKLANLMIDSEVGVSVERVVKIQRVDLDYFEDG